MKRQIRVGAEGGVVAKWWLDRASALGCRCSLDEVAGPKERAAQRVRRRQAGERKEVKAAQRWAESGWASVEALGTRFEVLVRKRDGWWLPFRVEAAVCG